MKGVTFGSYHSYDDFNLILSQKIIGTPSPKTNVIDIAGGDGVLDLTEYFGDVKYNNRSISFDFSTTVPQAQFMDLFSQVQNALHGQKMRITLDDDPEFYYVGRISVSEWKTDKSIGKLTIDCDCDPWKFKTKTTSKMVKLCGRNMVNLSAAVKMTSNGIWTQTETGFDFVRAGVGGSYVYFSIPVKAGNTYAFSANGTTYHDSIALIVYSDRMYGTTVAYAGNGAPAIFTAKMNGIFVFALNTFSTSNDASFRNVMVEESASVGSFEAYSEETQTSEELFVNLKKAAFPKLFLQGTATLTSGTTSQAFESGTHLLPNFLLKSGNTPIAFTGNGVAVVEWQEGGL